MAYGRVCEFVGPCVFLCVRSRLAGARPLPAMANRIRSFGFVAFSLLAAAACANPTSIDSDPTAEAPPPPVDNGAGTTVATGVGPSLGGATGSGGAAGAAGMGGEAGAPGGGGATGTGGAPTTTPGLEGSWAFEDLGEATTKDGSGHAHHGSLVGSGVTLTKSGKVGAAASFSGGDGRISISGATALDFNSAATIELWVKLSSTSTGAIVARQGSSGDGVRIRTSAGNVQVAFTRPGGSAMVTSDPNMLTNAWTHVAVVNDGSSLKLYLNGKLHRSEAGGQLGNVSGNLYVGKSGTDSALNGYVDELKWWSVARTNAEICSDAGGAWTNGECAL